MKKHLLMLLVAAMAMVMSLNAQTIIIDEGFEDGIQDSVWTQEYVSGETSWMVEGENDGLSWPETVKQGTHRAYLRNTTGETQGYVTRLVSKTMDLSPRKIYQPELSFWYANPKWGADRDTLRVLYRTSAKGDWKQLSEFSTAMANWQKVTISLPEVGPTYQIAFEGTDNLGRGIVLDSVKLRSAPECTVPHDLMASNLGANKVNISWAASWDAEYFELLVTKDTVNLDAMDEISEDIVAYHGMVSGLQQNYDLTLESGELYYAYVRSICEKETSLWSSEASEDGVFKFRVRATKQVPYYANFDYASTQIQDPEWTWGNNTGNTNPYVNSKMSKSARAPYSKDSSPAVIFSGGTTPKVVIPAGNYVYLATPAIADTTNENFSLNQCQVRFWSTVYIYTGRQYGRGIIVGVMDDPDDITTFVPVDTVTVWGNKEFQENIVDLSKYEGNGAFVAFVSDFDRQNLFYLDDVSVEYRPAVEKVTKISVNPRDTFATIEWEGNASEYHVLITNAEVDPTNPDAEAIVDQATVTTNSYLCEVLEEDHSWDKPYYVYVQADTMEWSYRYPFVTLASEKEIPYTFDFETASGRYKIGTGSTYYIRGLGIFGNDPKYPSQKTSNYYKGSACLFMNKTAGADTWVTLPLVEDLDSTQVKFFLSGYNTYSQAHATIGVMTNPMDINTFQKVSSFTLNTTGYTMCYANFKNYDGPEDGVIAIVWDDILGLEKNTINYIDELKIEKLSECVPPTDLEIEVEADSITLSWAASQNNMWEIAISRSALTAAQKDLTFAEIAALGQVVYADTVYWDDETTAPVIGIGELASQTDYVLYIRTVCGGDAAWWTEMKFSTPCPDAEFPYKEDFEGLSSISDLGCWQMIDYMGTGYPTLISVTGHGKCMELWSTGTTHRNVVILPPVEGELSDMMLSFETRSYGSYSSSVLYVGTMGDINDQNSFVPFDTIYNTAGGDFQKVRLVLDDYPLAYDNIAFSSGLGTLSQNSDLYLDNIELRDANCIEAFNFKQTAEDQTSVDFEWEGLSSNDQWAITILNTERSLTEVATGDYNDTEVIIADSIHTGKTFHATGLQPITTYYVYIRTLCGDSVWGMNTVVTACEMLDPNVANRETFDDYSSGTSYSVNYQAPCWTTGNAASDASSSYLPYIYKSGTYASSGTNSYRMYGYSSSYYGNEGPAYIVSPQINCTHMKELAVTFNMYASPSYDWICGVMTDPDDLSTFVVLDSVSGEDESKPYVYDLSLYEALIPPTAKYFAWRTPYDETGLAYLDDVSIVKMTCPFTKPSHSDLTAASVRISSGLRTDDEWLLLVSDTELVTDSLLSPTFVVPQDHIVFFDTIDVRSKLVSGLSDQTVYYVYTATLCDGTFNHVSSLSFTTPCRPMKPEELGTITFSEEEGYESGAGGYMPCWTVGSKTVGVSSLYIPYVDASSSNQHNGNNSLKIFDYVSNSSYSSSNYVGAYAIMPELDVDSISKYQVNFWGRGYYSSDNCQVIVGVVADPSDLNTFVAVDTVNLSQTTWEPYSIGFEEYEGDYLGNMGRNIMFLSEFGMTNYAYLSEISVELIPKCRPVSSFTVDSIGESTATVSWKGYQDTYRLLVTNRALSDDEKPTHVYLIDSIVDHSDLVRITGLNPATYYYVYAQGICSATDSTSISLQYASFRTECPNSTGLPLPFEDDFESYPTGNSDVGCWLFRNVSGSTYPKIEAVSDLSTQAVDLYSPSSGGRSWIVAPVLNGSLADMLLTFDARTWSTSASANQYLYVGTIADPEDPTTFVALDTIELTGSSTFSHYEMMLGDYDLAYDRLVFTSGVAATQASSDVYVDNISLTYLSNCHAPKLKMTGSTANSISVQIVPSKAEDSHWQYVVMSEEAYGQIASMATYLSQTTPIDVTGTNFTISDLEPATTYYIYARTVCGGEEGYSDWSRTPLKATTQFYFKESYFFGFEKTEQWQRSINSTSDNYYIHPALATGRDTLGLESTSYVYYPYSVESTSSYLYSHTDNGALVMTSAGNYFGGYVIFPAIDEAQTRSFEFKIRPGYISATTMRPVATSAGELEIGTIDKNTSFDTYRKLATIRLDALNSDEVAAAENDYLFKSFTLDLDETTISNKQIVLHSPKQESLSSSMYIDNVQVGAAKGFSLVSLTDIVVDGLNATVNWADLGGPWNLYIKDEEGNTIKSYLNLSGVTSQYVEGLESREEYTAVLEAVPSDKTAGYVTTSSLTFKTTCQAQEPRVATGDFYWDFDDEYEWEANDVLAGTAADTAYMKPGCFTVGITYETAANGYQWLIQEKGYDYYMTLDSKYDRHLEAGRNDTHSMRVYTTSSKFNSYLVLPQLNCSLDTMMIEFYGRCFVNYDETYSTESDRGKIVGASYLGAGYSHSIVVGTLTDPTDFSTLQVLDTLTYKQTNLTSSDNVNDDPAGLRYWELMQLPLTGATGNYIVLFQPEPGLFFLDDLSVKAIGSTLFAPTNTQTSNITDNSAEMSWTVRHDDMSSVIVLLSAAGEEILRDTVSVTNYTASSLTPGSSYQWYVYQTNGTDDTPATATVSFATECVTITPDYTCGFEAAEGWSLIPEQNAYYQSLCWTYADAQNDTWSATYDPQNISNTETALYSYEGSSAVLMKGSYSSYSTTYQPYIAMPAMDINAYDTLQVSFWIRPAYVSASTGKVAVSYTGSSYSKSIIVGTMTDPNDASTFVAIDTVTYEGTLSTTQIASAENNYLFQKMSVELTGATGQYVALMTSFYEKGGSSRKNIDYIYLDNVSFERINECRVPSDLNADVIGGDFATISWTGDAANYILQVSTDPYFAEDTAFVVNDTIVGNTYTVSGLSNLTTYIWRVQSLCDGQFPESEFSTNANFRTKRSPYYYEPFNGNVSQTEWTFSSSHADNILDTESSISSSDNSYGFKRTTNNYGLEGSHYACVGYMSDYNWMVTPEFYLPEDDSVHFSMDLALTACNTSHVATDAAVSESDMNDDYYFMIIVSDDGGLTWKSENIIAKWQNTNAAGSQLRDIPSDGMRVRLSLAAYAGKSIRVGLYREAKTSSNTGIAIHVDNVRLAYFDKQADTYTACQYEDINIGDIHLSGDDTKPGIHYYPSVVYASDEEAKAGVRDFVYSLEINVLAVSEEIYADTICEGETYSDLNFTGKTKTGTYRRKLVSAYGCDSIITLNLTVTPRAYAEDLEVDLCPGESFTWNGKVYNRAGIYRDTLISEAGCDSIETLIISYAETEDTLFVNKTIGLTELPYTYDDPEHPLVAGQDPISYPAGTQKGEYKDVRYVESDYSECNRVLVHNLTIYDEHEAIDLIGDGKTARKVIYKDNLYIICNDEWYNAAGQKIQDPRL